MNRRRHVLVLDREALVRDFLVQYLGKEGFAVTTVGAVKPALDHLGGDHVDAVIFDWNLPELDGETFIASAKEMAPHAIFVATSAESTVDEAVAAMRCGVSEYLTKPFLGERIRSLLGRLLAPVSETAASIESRSSGAVSETERRPLIGSGAAMTEVRSLIDLAGTCEATVLITGETGTGKELVARAIHEKSGRGVGRLVRMNSAAVPETLYESELFGHEKGAFTGADRLKKGRFELAHRGTLLMDEISEINGNIQAKLLRVLQEKEFERVGGCSTIRVDTRVVATSNKDLAEEIRSGRFRSDLYYRLSVFPIHVPPLRQRSEDIPDLVEHFLAKGAANGRSREVTSAALEKLTRYEWPGNVRQLENSLERAAILARGRAIDSSDFPEINGHAGPVPVAVGIEEPKSAVSIRDMEIALLLKTIEACGGNRTAAARSLGITTRTLRNKLHRLGLMDFLKDKRGEGKIVPGERENSVLTQAS